MTYILHILYIKDAWQQEQALVRRMSYSLEHNVTDDFERLVAEMAQRQAHRHRYSLAAAIRQIRAFFVEACLEYRAAISPYDDDDHGFCHLAARKTTLDTKCVAWSVLQSTLLWGYVPAALVLAAAR